MEHLDEIVKAADSLESFIQRQAPMPNPAALNTVRMLCIRMKGRDSYITSKAGEIESRAAQYFSARKHASYPGGPFALREEITGRLLNSIRQQVTVLRTRD